MQVSYQSVHSKQALINEIEMAEELIAIKSTAFPDATFEEGYIAAINFVLGRYGSNVKEEFEEIMDAQ